MRNNIMSKETNVRGNPFENITTDKNNIRMFTVERSHF